MHIQDLTPAKLLGLHLRAARQELGLSTHAVAKAAGLAQSQVVRYEQGERATPDIAKIVAMAGVLGLNPAELLAATRYPVVADAISPALYLRAKYRDLPAGQLQNLQADVARTLAHYGLSATDGPAPGEDEA